MGDSKRAGVLSMLYDVRYIGADFYAEENCHVSLYLPGAVNGSYLHVFFKGSCWQIFLLAKAALNMEIHRCAPFPLSTLPCRSPCELPPATWSRSELVASHLSSPGKPEEQLEVCCCFSGLYESGSH